MKRVNIKYLAISAILILVLSLSSGCLPSNTEISPPPNSSPTNNTVDEIDSDWVPPLVESDAPVLPDFVAVVDKVKPSVVAIKTDRGDGSGWIIDESGYIVTNYHVVEGATNITATLDNGESFLASIVGIDWLTDLAVLKIDAENLIKVGRGDSDKLQVGEWVLAIGNSLGLGVTPSEGIVRALGASIPVSSGQMLGDLIGISAPINPGNSGGPLVNMAGEVVGITSIKIAMVGVEGMGWAISINSAIPIITQLISKGYVVRPYLGIIYRDLDLFLVLRYNLAVTEGVFVEDVVSGYPADEEAGLEAGDVIVSFDDKEITNGNDLRLAISSCQIGQRVEIIYWRDDTKSTTYATLIESPPP
ncbi:hypothetical protein ES703_124184 [subsurface metagenome]